MVCTAPVVSLRKDPLHRLVSAGLLVSSLAVVILTGCGIGPAAPHDAVTGTGTLMQGRVHGGQNPVTGATIQLWAASVTGYPGTPGFTAPTPLLTNPRMSGSDGGFSITTDYTCPPVPVGQPDTQVYMTATGGNPGAGSDNNNLVMMAALGSCTALQANAANTFIFMDEVTTVAAAYALAQFAAPNTSGTGIVIGTSPGNIPGLVNAMATANNMINLSTGQALTITPAYASNKVANLKTSTVPQARINTLANILANCVNTTGVGGSSTNCATLFSDASVTGSAAPVDTLQAILSIAQHPGNKASALFQFATTSPFSPTLAAPGPSDWTMPLAYTGGGLGIAPNQFFGAPTITPSTIEIDGNGNVFVTAKASKAELGVSSILAEFDNLGDALTAATTVSGTTVTYGGSTQESHLNGANTVLLDSSNNLWITTSGPGIFEIATDPSLSLTQTVTITGAAATGLAFDQFGKIWVEGGGSLGVIEYNGDGTSPVSYANPSGDTFANGMTFDSNGYLWGLGASGLYAYDFSGVTGTPGTTGSAAGTQLAEYPSSGIFNTPSQRVMPPLAADGLGNVYTCSADSTALNAFNATANTSAAAASYPLPGCITYPVVDGQGNIWAMSKVTTNVLQELNNSGTMVSPATGYSGTSTSEPAVFTTGSVTALAIDGSGNLWAANGTMSSGNAVVEFVGLAAPVQTPIAAAVAGGVLGTRP